jgi:hypothetical protein
LFINQGSSCDRTHLKAVPSTSLGHGSFFSLTLVSFSWHFYFSLSIVEVSLHFFSVHQRLVDQETSFLVRGLLFAVFTGDGRKVHFPLSPLAELVIG